MYGLRGDFDFGSGAATVVVSVIVVPVAEAEVTVVVMVGIVYFSFILQSLDARQFHPSKIDEEEEEKGRNKKKESVKEGKRESWYRAAQ